jgi:RNA polymerase sigma-70 factor (ECF subfamily)
MNNTGNHTGKLIEKCMNGDMQAQFILYKKYSRAMYNIAIRILNNKMDAEDILQESFITAFSRLSELNSERALGSWLKRIVINNCISHIRKDRMIFEDIEEYRLGEEEEPDMIDSSIDPVIVHRAIKELPGGCRTVLVLHSLEGYKHREIAEMLDITISTSKTQYRRALGLLNEKLKHRIYVN